MNDSTRIARLRLHSVLRPPTVVTFDGPLFQKSRRGSKAAEGRLRRSARRQLKKSKWKPPPRARIAVSFTFFAGGEQSPELHNLCKFYLDVLETEAFKDDRQVAYLEASLWRSGGAESGGTKVYVEIKRWTDFKKRFKVVRELMNLFPDLEDLLYPQDSADFYQSIVYGDRDDPISWMQGELFGNSTLGHHHSPLTPMFAKEFESIDQLDPFTISLPSLPGRGGTSDFKATMSTAIKEYVRHNPVVASLRIALALDIRLTTQGFRASKDLDNLVQLIYPDLAKMLGPGGKVNAFRVYLVKTLPGRDPGCIWLKLLPFGAIQTFNRRIETLLEEADERLKGYW